MYWFFNKNSTQYIGAWTGGGRGTRERPPPPIGKNCCRNLVLFSKALLLATTFPEIIGKSFFSIDFSSKIFKIFLPFSQPLVFSVQTWENLTHGF